MNLWIGRRCDELVMIGIIVKEYGLVMGKDWLKEI